MHGRPSILHIVGDSRFGGGTLVIAQLGRAAAALGWQPYVLTTDAEAQAYYHERGISVVAKDVVRRSIHPLRDVIGLFRLVRILRDQRFDAVHTHTSKGGMVGRMAAWLARTPIIVHTVHGFAFHEQSGWFARMAYSALERLASHWCDAIVCVSQFHADWALQLGIGNPAKVFAIPNGVEALPKFSSYSAARARLALKVPPETTLLFSMGRLASQKGFPWLIDAVAILRKTCSRPVELAIAGEGPLSDELREHARTRGILEHVHFLGFRRDIPELLAASDIVVLPSLWEGLSIALLEAMRAGRPIVTTTIESNLEVAGHGEVALLVPPKDAEALAGAVVRLIEDPGLRTRLADEAQRVLVEHYSEDRVVAAYRDLYAQLSRRRSGLSCASGRVHAVPKGGYQ
ncbi:MAG: glycosyltransferase family 4 protein [Bryobacteraceae bacterium]|nr:glycosyltransferase family 4 protein [Solibacteraceae bacterium]MCO5352618.1 glycosyltransferase family 4 protein [Bryobacteraceae bacterium]